MLASDACGTALTGSPRPKDYLKVQSFYFSVRDGDRLTLDPDGADLPDLDAALAKATEAIREAASRPLKPGQDLSGRRFEIADESGRVLATVAFRDVIGWH